MELKRFNNIKKIKKYYDKFDGYYPFQDYEVLKSISNFRYRAKEFFRHPFWKNNFIFYTVLNENEPIMFVPLKRNKSERNCVEMLGSGNYFDYSDAIYNTQNNELLKQAYDLIFDDLKKLGFQKLLVNYNPEDSITREILGNFEYNKLEDVECVKLNFENNWDEYFSKLTKSNRQNIRTSYNRLSRDGYNLSFECHFCNECGGGHNLKNIKKLYKDCFKVYLKRQNIKYSNNGFISKLIKLINYKYFHYASQCAFIESGFVSAIKVNGEVIAFMSGFVDKKRNAIEIPRLAMNDKFKFYSPGMMLLCETIKYLMSNTDIRCLDLCRGTEKYKFDIGGNLYNTYNFSVKF